MSYLRESDIEESLVRKVKEKGGLAIKFISPSLSGIPDRLLLLPGGRFAFVELKAPGKKPRALQRRRMKQLSALGFSCYIVDNVDLIEKIIHQIGGDAK